MFDEFILCKRYSDSLATGNGKFDLGHVSFDGTFSSKNGNPDRSTPTLPWSPFDQGKQ